MFGYDLGIDLGSSSIVITVPGKGVVVNEPSYVAYDTETEKILYAGRRAYYLEGREPDGVTVIQPIVNGAVTNYSIAQQMVKFLLIRLSEKAFSSQELLQQFQHSARMLKKERLFLLS